MPSIGPPFPCRRRQADDAVSSRLLPRYRLYRHQAVSGGLEALHHLLGAPRSVAVDQVVGKQDRERLVADRGPRAQHRVTETERRRLANVDARHATRENVAHARQQVGLPLGFEYRFQLRRSIEVILDGLLRMSGDEHELLDPGRHRLLHRVLDEGLVDDGKHLLGERLRGRQETGAETRHGKDRLSNPDRHLPIPLSGITCLLRRQCPPAGHVSRCGSPREAPHAREPADSPRPRPRVIRAPRTCIRIPGSASGPARRHFAGRRTRSPASAVSPAPNRGRDKRSTR